MRGKFSIIQQNESITLDVKRFVLDFHFAKNFYDKEHYYYRWMISIGIFVLILTPFLFDSFSVDMIFEILLTTGIAFILWIIWMEIEGRIIYALLKYLDCMKQFGELLCMNKDEKTKKYERIFKRETGSKKDADRARKIGINSDDIISLSHGYNANIWIENHLMMSTEANLYFKRFQYIFFSLMIGVVLVAFIFAYNLIIITTPILSLQMLVMCIGFLNVIFVWSEMLIISNKFSKLEKKHIEALINQKVWIQQKIFDLNIRNQNIDTSDFNIFHLQQTLILIDHLQQKLQLNGLSPKIAGISMDKAFIRVTWSLIISMITSGFAYYLRKNV